MHPARPVFDRLLAGVPAHARLHRWLASMRTQVYDRVEDVIDDLAGYNDEADYEEEVSERAAAARAVELHDGLVFRDPSTGMSHTGDVLGRPRDGQSTYQVKVNGYDFVWQVQPDAVLNVLPGLYVERARKEAATRAAQEERFAFLSFKSAPLPEATPAAPFARLDAINDRIEAAAAQARQGVIEPKLRDRVLKLVFRPPDRKPEDVDVHVARAVAAYLDASEEEQDDALKDARRAVEKEYGPDADVWPDGRAVGMPYEGSWPVELQSGYDVTVGRAFADFIYHDWARRIRARAASTPAPSAREVVEVDLQAIAKLQAAIKRGGKMGAAARGMLAPFLQPAHVLTSAEIDEQARLDAGESPQARQGMGDDPRWMRSYRKGYLAGRQGQRYPEDRIEQRGWQGALADSPAARAIVVEAAQAALATRSR